MRRRPGDPERDHSSPLDLDEPTVELRTLRITIPMPRPGEPLEGPFQRTALWRRPPGGAASPCHPDTLDAAARTRRQRVALAVVLLLALVLVPLAVGGVCGLSAALAPADARPPAPEAIPSSSGSPSAPSTEPSAPAATPTPSPSSALPAPSTAAFLASSAPRPVRRPSPASKPRSRSRSDLVDPWGD